jgi:hypothetical protein
LVVFTVRGGIWFLRGGGEVGWRLLLEHLEVVETLVGEDFVNDLLEGEGLVFRDTGEALEEVTDEAVARHAYLTMFLLFT